MVRLRLWMSLFLVAAVAAPGCGDSSGNNNGDGGGGAGGDLAAGGGGGDLATFTPHALWLGLPSATMSTKAHLRASDVVYASDQMSAGAVSVKNGAAGTRAAVLLP